MARLSTPWISLKQFHRVANLVRLQMADEMPARLAGAQRNFRLGFLNLVFAEQKLSGFDRLADGFRRMRFGHGQQRDACGIATGPFTRGGDALPDGV